MKLAWKILKIWAVIQLGFMVLGGASNQLGAAVDAYDPDDSFGDYIDKAMSLTYERNVYGIKKYIKKLHEKE